MGIYVNTFAKDGGMQTLEDKRSEFENNTLMHWKPVDFLQ